MREFSSLNPVLGRTAAGRSAPLVALRWVAVLWLLAVVPLASVLPRTLAWENALIENTQLAELLLGCVIAAWWSFKRPMARGGALALGLAPVWFVLAARETSWGATLGAPLYMSANGPVFSSSQLAYKPVVYPVIGLLLLFSVVVFVRFRVLPQVMSLIRSGRFPWPELALVVVAAMLSTIGEGHLKGVWTPPEQMGALIEELSEVAAYGMLMLAQWSVFRQIPSR